MISPPDDITLAAMVRLSTNQDFERFLAWLAYEEKQVNRELKRSQNAVIVHQLQGSSLMLEDIRQTIESATTQVAAQRRG